MVPTMTKEANRRGQFNIMVNHFHKVNLSEVIDVVSLGTEVIDVVSLEYIWKNKAMIFGQTKV